MAPTDSTPATKSTPANPTIFALSTPTTDSPGAASITFTAANLDPSDTIDWSTRTVYTTSGGVKSTSGPKPTPLSPPGPGPNQSTTNQFTGVGGEMTVYATAEKYTDSVTVFIVGPPWTNFPDSATSNTIDPANITTELTDVYQGMKQICPNPGGKNTPIAFTPATAGLMTQVAMLESTYQQFFNETLPLTADGYTYEIDNVWPHENGATSVARAGAHIGLMMVPTTMVDAWDWLQNVTDGILVPTVADPCESVTEGLSSFQYKLGTASRL